MSNPQSICIYCGALGTTKEHIWGKWSRDESYYAGVANPKNLHSVIHYDRGSPIIVERKGMLTRPGLGRSQTLKIACRDCNGGWMKASVDASIPILGPMTKGEWVDLDEDKQRILSAWIAQFVMTYEYADRRTICVSQEDRDFLRLNGFPSGRWDIAVGRADATMIHDHVFHRALIVDPNNVSGGIKSHVTSIMFGKLIGFATYNQRQFDAGAFILFCLQHGLKPIWPLRQAKVTMPVVSLSDIAYEMLVYDFTRK